MTTHTKCLIIGGGPAGYTAAIYAARANLQPIVIQGMQPGGQLTITTDVENYPGFALPIQGPWLMEEMQKQAEHMGAQMVFDLVTHIDFSNRPFVVKTDGGETYVAETIIVATGAQAKWLGLPTEEFYRGAGVSACATCDGFFFRGKTVAVIGGGNTAVEEAIYLTNHAAKVYVIHRRDSFRAEQIMQDRLFKNPKISVMWNTQVLEVLGRGDGNLNNPKEVTGLRLLQHGGHEMELGVDGMFVAIGHAPATEFLRSATYPTKEVMEEDIDVDVYSYHVSVIEDFLSNDGYINVQPGTPKTVIPGVYAAGDVADRHYKQAVTAAGMGCMAALEAERFLAGH